MKKLIALLLVLVVSLTLTACKDKESNFNTNTPYGTLSDTTEYASVGTHKITEKQLYDQLRASGYTYLTQMFVEKLLPANTLNITDNREELKELIDLACYGTKELDDLNSTTKEKSVQKYIDNMFLKGVTITKDNIYTDECLSYYLPQLAKEKYALSVLKDTNSKYYYGNENYTNENGEEVKNPYYISEEAIETRYVSNFEEDATYTVVIIGFPTLAEAQAALAGYTITKENAGTVLKEVYNNVYHFKTADFELTSEDLRGYNASLISLISNMKAGDYKLNQEFGKTIYHIYLETEKPEAKYETITADEKQEVIDDILDGFASSFTTTAINELLLSANATIYDPVYDTLFAQDNKNHTRLAKDAEWNNNLVAKVNGKDITVQEFYNKLEKELGYSTAADYLTTRVLLNSTYASKLTAADLETINNNFESTMKSFENNEFEAHGYPSSMDENVFKFLYFGNTSEEEIINGFKAQKLWEYKIADKPESYYESLVHFGQKYVEKYFNLSVKHVLLFVDYDSDGTPDDPELFINNLSEADAKKFEAKITELFNLYLAEVNYLVEKDWANLVDALTYVQKEFYANGAVHHTADEKDTWATYKKDSFGIGITVEDLSSVNVTNASNYVPEFGEGVQKLYNKLVAEKIIENNKLDEDYLPAKVVEEAKDGKEGYNHIIKTSYGYHVLGVYDCDDFTDAKYTADDDRSEIYKNITVTLNGTELTGLNAYSENKYASLNQIKIYAAQIGTEDGVTELPTDVQTFIAYFYPTVKSKYESAAFQNILFAKHELKDLKFANQTNGTRFNEYIEIQKRSFDSYTDTSDSYLGDWWTVFNA